ncbi:methyltransferase domain-containing protein [Actinoallomurus sp. CA-150999]|uniref:class I SAM-dependent methyltransferase n=1 Tax=Actinoallomurus sp. CA-150999 TaxID=3239887 RepID=UPI003D8D3874
MSEAAVTGYAVEWLDLREDADAAARNAELVDLLIPSLADASLTIRDLGCGTGSMGRWLAARLPGPQRWILHDRDPALLAEAATRPPETAADGAPVTVTLEQGDATGLRATNLAGTSLVTASALLDLLTAEEVAGLASACAGAGCPTLLTLTVAGRVEFLPADPLDAELAAAFDDHQRRTVGGGTAPVIRSPQTSSAPDPSHALPGAAADPSQQALPGAGPDPYQKALPGAAPDPSQQAPPGAGPDLYQQALPGAGPDPFQQALPEVAPDPSQQAPSDAAADSPREPSADAVSEPSLPARTDTASRPSGPAVRRLLGPDAADAAAAAFERSGMVVHRRPSPWRLGPAQAELTAQWLRGWVAAAVEQRPDLADPAEAYLRRRLAACAAGALRVVIGHDDLLALPPAGRS